MPALNEAATIHKVLKSVPLEFDGFQTARLLVVNDGSTDATAFEAEKASAMVISHHYNKGVGVAFKTAVDYALKINIDVMVSIDADGQFDVNQIGEFIAPIANNKADFCIGNRFYLTKPKNMPYIKFWGNKQINKIVSWVSGTKIKDASCGFRAYSKETLWSLNLHGNFTYTHEVILDLLNKGYKVTQIPVSVRYFDGRVSRVAGNLFSYALKTSRIIFKCFKDYRPFPFFMSIAGFIFLIAIIIGGFVAIHWWQTGAITPYKSFGFIALALCGLAVLVTILALVADMLNRLRMNQERTMFLIKKQYFDKD